MQALRRLAKQDTSIQTTTAALHQLFLSSNALRCAQEDLRASLQSIVPQARGALERMT